MIGIIGAMKAEIDGIKNIITDKKIETVSGIEFVSGKIEDTEVVAAQSGIGKVFAAICAQTMILLYKPDTVINIGVGGTLSKNLNVGDIAVATAVVQHDMDTSPLGDPVGLLSGIDIIEIPCDSETADALCSCIASRGINFERGIISSGDQFIASEVQKLNIKKNFDAVACEMEGGSIGHVCYVNGVKFCILRAISDSANGEASLDYPSFMKLAAKNSVNVMTDFLRRN